MKLYNISGTYGKDKVKFTGLYLIHNDGTFEEVYFINEKNQDIDDLRNLGKRIFDIIKKYNIEDVEIAYVKNIKNKPHEYEFIKAIKEIIKGCENIEKI